jgi:hypothetical protein
LGTPDGVNIHVVHRCVPQNLLINSVDVDGWISGVSYRNVTFFQFVIYESGVPADKSEFEWTPSELSVGQYRLRITSGSIVILSDLFSITPPALRKTINQFERLMEGVHMGGDGAITGSVMSVRLDINTTLFPSTNHISATFGGIVLDSSIPVMESFEFSWRIPPLYKPGVYSIVFSGVDRTGGKQSASASVTITPGSFDTLNVPLKSYLAGEFLHLDLPSFETDIAMYADSESAVFPLNPRCDAYLSSQDANGVKCVLPIPMLSSSGKYYVVAKTNDSVAVSRVFDVRVGESVPDPDAIAIIRPTAINRMALGKSCTIQWISHASYSSYITVRTFV